MLKTKLSHQKSNSILALTLLAACSGNVIATTCNSSNPERTQPV